MEMVMSNGFCEMTMDGLMEIDGGRNWVATVAGTVAGAACVVGGVAGLCLPDPTTASKVVGWSAITCGVATVVWAWS